MPPRSPCSPCATGSWATRELLSHSTQTCIGKYRSAEYVTAAPASVVGVVGRLVGAEPPHDPRRCAAADQGRQRESTAGHLRAPAKIADTGTIQSRRIPRFIDHSNAVVPYFETERQTLPLQLNPDCFRLRMLCDVVEQFLQAAEHMRRNALRNLIVLCADLGSHG